MARTSAAPAVARRIIRTLPAITPRARAWLLAGFLAANVALALLPAGDAERLGWLGSPAWLRELDAETEVTLANSYSVVVWSAIAVLGLAQLVRPAASSARSRLRVFGWLSVAILAALVALEEGLSVKDMLAEDMSWVDAVTPGPNKLPPNTRWLVAAAPLCAPLLAAAGWVFHIEQRGHPAMRLLTLLVAILLVEAVAQDAYNVLSIGIGAWQHLMEEAAQIVGAAALVVILVEMLAVRPSAHDVCQIRTRERWVVTAVGAALLAASALPLVAHRAHPGDGWDTVAPWSYTGPITLVEQRFRAHRDNLSRIDVWAYADGGPPGRAAEIFARLTPEGVDAPIRESRAEARGARFSTATVAFKFEPIPDSNGKVYTLAVGVLGRAPPYVFLGMTGSDLIPEGAAIVSGAATRYGDDLAMRTAWIGRLIDGLYPRDPHHWGLIAEVVLHLCLWVFLVVATWAGLSGSRPRFWRRFVWPALVASALVTAGVVGLILTFLTPRLPTVLA